MSKRFSRKRWRRPERMTLEHPPVQRRKDLGVSEAIDVEPELGRKRTRTRLRALLIVYIALCAVEGAVIGAVWGLGWMIPAAALLYGVLYFVVAREFGDAWLVRALRARPATGPRVMRLAEAEAATAGIAAPKVVVVDGDFPNACSFALRQRWLACTESCESLEELSLEGLVAHEIVHLRDGESSVAALYAVLAGGPELVARRAGVLCLLSVPLWPVALVLRLGRGIAQPADREHRADIAAAMLTRYPPGVAAAIAAALAISPGGRRGFRPLDTFWFVPAGRAPGPSPAERADLLNEM